MDFSGATESLLDVSHVCSVFKYCCAFVSAVFCLLWMDVIVMSSA